MFIRTQGILLLAFYATLICSSGCISIPNLSGSPSYPFLIPETSFADDSFHTFTFPFSGKNAVVTIPVPAALYEGAQAADKNAYLLPGTKEKEWVPDYYRAFASDPAHDAWFDAVLASLREARPEISTGTDQYAEYLTAFVQQIRYTETDRLGEPKFPVETIADEEGDCDDKSILLAGLLSREGYNVSLFYLAENHHMAVGITGSACAYQGTGYGYLEATSQRYPGTSPEDYPNSEPIDEVPIVIRIGSGTSEYGGCPAIAEALRSSYEMATQLEPAIREESEKLAQQKAEIDNHAALLQQYSDSGDIRSYNRLIPGYNRLVERYNQDLAEHRKNFALYEEAANLYNLLAGNAPDRNYVCTQTEICTATDSGFRR